MTLLEENPADPSRSSRDAPGKAVMELGNSPALDRRNRPFVRRAVAVEDESDQDPVNRDKLFAVASEFEALLIEHPLSADDAWKAPRLGLSERGEDPSSLVVDPGNLAAVELYFLDGKHTQMYEWGHQMMQAIALEPLQKLQRGGKFLKAQALDQRTLERFTFMPDGRGLRSRQRIYSQLLVERAKRSDAERLDVVSLGSGAAIPNIEASQRIEAEIGKHVRWQLFDLDARALFHANRLTRSAGLTGSTFDLGPVDGESTLTRFRGRSYIEARHLPAQSLDAVDALGLWEYLGPSQAVAFLKMMYPKLKPGAPMIVSNMLVTRPHPEYNKRAVGWPKVIMRSEQDLMDIVFRSGVPEPHVTLTHATDGVYVVMEITTPGR